MLSLPFLGKLHKGQCLNKENVVEQMAVPTYLKPQRNSFIIQVDGDSMRGSGILDRDFLVISPHNTANNNDIVLATIDNIETVIKHFEQTNDLIFLNSLNSEIKPMIFDPSRIKILGIVNGQMRSYESS